MKFIKLFLILILFSVPIIAQEQDLTTLQNLTDEITELKAELTKETQDPATKNVKFNLKLTSNINSDRVKLTWTSTGPNKYVEGQKYQFEGLNAIGELRIRNGQTYNIPLELNIYGTGVSELIGKVEIFLSEGTKVLTVRSNFGSNADGEVLPLTDEYTQARNLNNIKNIVLIAIIFIVVIIASYLGLRKFLKWLDRDERKL